MDEPALNHLKELFKDMPRFPDGRIDYTNAKEIYGVSVVVEYEGKVLFLKRAGDLHFYPGLWNVVTGFIDEEIGSGEIALKELAEETGISGSKVGDMKFTKERLIKDPSSGITWHIFPVLVQLAAEPEININWEHTEFRWILPEDTTKYDRVPLVEENIRLALSVAEAKV